MAEMKDEKITVLKRNGECCHEQLMQQAELLRQHEDEELRKNERLQTLCEARDEYKFKATDLEAECRKLQKEIQGLKDAACKKSFDFTERRVLEAVVESVTDEKNKYMEKLKLYELVNNELKEKLAEAEKNLTTVDKKSLEKENSILLKENKDLMSATKDLNTILKQKTEAVEDLTRKLEQAEGYLAQGQKMQKAWKCEKEQLKRELKAMTDTSSNTQAKSAGAKEQNQKLHDQIQALEERVRHQESELENLKIKQDAQNRSYEETLRGKQDEIDLQKNEIRRYQEEHGKTPAPSQFRPPKRTRGAKVLKENDNPSRDCEVSAEHPEVASKKTERTTRGASRRKCVSDDRQLKRTKGTKIPEETDNPGQDCEVSAEHPEVASKKTERTTRAATRRKQCVAEDENSPVIPKRATRKRRV